MANSKDGLKVLMEFIGTFILSAGINFSTLYKNTGNGLISQEGQPILLFLAFFSAITITRSISGGHINPAVTIAFYFSKQEEKLNNLEDKYYKMFSSMETQLSKINSTSNYISSMLGS